MQIMASGTIMTTRHITLASTPERAREAVQQAMVARKGKIQPGVAVLTAKFGSQLMLRLIGGWLMPISAFPVKADATFTPVDGGTAVTINVADSMGVGIKAGMKGKYERAVEGHADALSAVTV